MLMLALTVVLFMFVLRHKNLFVCGANNGNEPQQLSFTVPGIGQLISQEPHNLSQLLYSTEYFCDSSRSVFLKVIPEHRCEWLVSGAMLEAMAKLQGHKNIENIFLRIQGGSLTPIENPSFQKDIDIKRILGKTILFLLHDAVPEKKHVLNGGTQAIMEVAFGLKTIGNMHVKIACLNSAIPIFENAYPDSKKLNLFLGYDKFTTFLEDYKTSLGRNDTSMVYDYIVATYFVTAWMLKSIHVHSKKMLSRDHLPKLIYFIQDYEAWFPLPIAYKYAAKLSYFALKDFGVKLCTYSFWIKNMLKKFHNIPFVSGHNINVIKQLSETFDVKLYHVDTHPITSLTQNKHHEKYTKFDSFNAYQPYNIRIGIMLRPHTPRRATARSLNLLDRFARLNLPNVEFHTFGCEMSTFRTIFPKQLYENNTNTFLKHHGILDRAQMVRFLKTIDMFVDVSLWQAFGFTAFEGMSAGVVPIIQNTSGLATYVIHDENGILVQERDGAADGSAQRLIIPYMNAIRNLIKNKIKLNRLSHSAKTTARNYERGKTTNSWINLLN
jgi:glycosyltransferase involved in cell wall biosynthesis